MALPTMTNEDRGRALALSATVRAARAALKEQVTSGEVSVREVIDRGLNNDSVAGGILVAQLVHAIAKVGPVRAAAIMDDANISPTRRVRGLGPRQRVALLALVESGADQR